jgi:glycosyltransferase involved in cell wall biosynthesis
MISVTVLTKNCERTLEKTLQSVRSFPEVLVVDTGSTDRTLEIARQFPHVTIHTVPFSGFGPTHNLASSLAQNDWILSLDSDEVLSDELIQEIQKTSLDPACVYAIQRHNYFNGKQIKGCGGWHPDRVVRLYHRKATKFTSDEVHEKIIADGLKTISFVHPAHHTPYLEMADFLAKMQTYTTLFAKQHKGKKQGSLLKAIAHAWLAFFKSYILKRGFLDGREGFIISVYNSHTTFYKYLKLAETP